MYHEDIRGGGNLLSDLKKLEQVVELAMDVSTHCHWRLHLVGEIWFQEILRAVPTSHTGTVAHGFNFGP